MKGFSMWMICFVSMLTACSQHAEVVDSTPPAEQWLAKIEAQAGEVKTLRAEMIYRREQGVLADVQFRYGTLIYQAGPPAKFVAHLDRHSVNGGLFAIDKRFIYDGRYLVDRDADEKIFSRHELAKEGEERDLLALGEGPFAVPLNLKRDQVLERFLVAIEEDDGDNAPVHLVLTPREGVDAEATQIDLWFDRETLLPVKVRTFDAETEDTTQVSLKNIEVNPDEVDDATFDTSSPTQPGWQINEHPLSED